MTDTAAPSPRVVEQRVRNRIIEYLELASSFEDQLEYQAVAPVSVSNEVINQWEDWVRDDPAKVDWSDAYTSGEVAALTAFHQVWTAVADATPNPLGPIEQVQTDPAWHWLRQAALATLAVFDRRGRLSEHVEWIGSGDGDERWLSTTVELFAGSPDVVGESRSLLVRVSADSEYHAVTFRFGGGIGSGDTLALVPMRFHLPHLAPDHGSGAIFDLSLGARVVGRCTVE